MDVRMRSVLGWSATLDVWGRYDWCIQTGGDARPSMIGDCSDGVSPNNVPILSPVCSLSDVRCLRSMTPNFQLGPKSKIIF